MWTAKEAKKKGKESLTKKTKEIEDVIKDETFQNLMQYVIDEAVSAGEMTNTFHIKISLEHPNQKAIVNNVFGKYFKSLGYRIVLIEIEEPNMINNKTFYNFTFRLDWS